MIAMVLVMPLTGFLGSLFGQKRVYLIVARRCSRSARCCAARRARSRCSCCGASLQGLGGGALQPTQQAILRQTFPPEEQGMAMARVLRWSIMVGPAVGPVLGGYITDNYSWPWIFFINLPVGMLGIYHDGRATSTSRTTCSSRTAQRAAARSAATSTAPASR